MVRDKTNADERHREAALPREHKAMRQTRSASEELIGEQIGDYLIERVLGEGGMGVVYFGIHESLGRRAAIKVLKPALASDREITERFFNEAKAANQIAHPGIVDVYEAGFCAEAGAYLIMEYLEGETLAGLLERNGPLSLALAALIVKRIASPLAAAHAAGIVHRDLKPDNIFLIPDLDHPGDLRIKLLDFGVAKLRQASPSLRTATGALLGTPFFMSPEQAHGAREVDSRSDLYALGVIAYQLLSGQLPFTATGFGELLLKHQQDTPAPLRSWNGSIPAAIEATVMRALAKAPADRFATVQQMAEAFALAAADAEQALRLPGAAGVPGPLGPTLPGTGSGMISAAPLSAGSPTLPLVATQATPSALASASLDASAAPAHTGPLAAAARTNQGSGPFKGSGPSIPKTLHSRSDKVGAESSTSRRPTLRHWAILGAGLALALGVAAFWLARPGDPRRRVQPAAQHPTTDPRPATHDLVAPAAAPAAAPVPPRDDAPMIRIPAGPFISGSAKRAQRQDLGAFAIDRHEVTVAQYRRCVDAGGCDGRKVSGTELVGQVPFRRSPACNWNRSGAANHPINCVSWHEAASYCRWAGKALPTPQQWEKAARGSDGRSFPWGEAPPSCKRAVIKAPEIGCGSGGTWAVGSRSPEGDSPFGVVDMVGNVAEWIDRASESEPLCQVRGGAFSNPSAELSLSRSLRFPAGYRLEDLGFRCSHRTLPGRDPR